MKCFVIMPFRPEFDDVYDVIRQGINGAVPVDPVTCRRLDEVKAAGRITEDLLREIREAVLCIADVTGNNPNVMWELGYAMALQKPTLLISQDVSTLPFDLKDLRSIPYRRDALSSTLREPLAEAIRHTLSSLSARTDARRIPMAPASGFTVALTGSMRANRSHVKRRLEVVLQPLLSVTTHWLLGSWGDVDVIALIQGGNEHGVEVDGPDAVLGLPSAACARRIANTVKVRQLHVLPTLLRIWTAAPSTQQTLRANGEQPRSIGFIQVI